LLYAARAISILGHPFVTCSVTVLATTAPRTALVFMLISIVPVAILMFVQVRRGAWEHVDASRKRERPALYVVGIIATAAAFAWLAYAQPHSPLTRGVGVALGMLIALAVITRWIKVSLHVTFAALSATLLLIARLPGGWAMAALVPLLIWSRLQLHRHTRLEVAIGLVAGVATGLLMYAIAK
jgi:membrane-associated phospholipid phosphatase